MGWWRRVRRWAHLSPATSHLLRAGDCAAFPKGDRNGHHLVNRSNATVRCLEVGARKPAEDACTYPDIDLHLPAREQGFTHRDGTPYPARR